MIRYNNLDQSKKAYIFEFDNLLYPEKDYLLQVYYLFANFVEYTEAFPPATELVEFMKKAFEHHGKERLFDKVLDVFAIDEKYRENFERLHKTARLPLKLLLFDDKYQLLKDMLADGKEILIVTGGDPAMQLNKVGQTDWQGLAPNIRLYFADELKPKPAPDILTEVMNIHKLKPEDMLLIGNTALDRQFAASVAIDFFDERN